MPKLKTHKGAQARFHITGTGKLMRAKIGGSHLRLHKSKRTRRMYEERVPVSSRDVKRLKKLVPFGT